MMPFITYSPHPLALMSRDTMPGSDDRQLGKRTPCRRASLAVSNRELCGRFAGVG
jgi:hypothetical protein